MPELPEVETIVKGLNKKIKGKRFAHVEVELERQLSNSTTEHFNSFIKGEKLDRVDRVGKYLQFIFESGKCFLTHLRMTGKFIFSDNIESEEERHIRMVFTFTDDSRLLYQDMRTFGTFKLYESGEKPEEMSRMGIEPLSEQLTPQNLKERFKGRKTPIKNALLDQSLIAGIGNIYACEILFDINLSPFTPACEVDEGKLAELTVSIRKILELAIENNGTSISDYRTVEDKTGNFQNMLKVYQKSGTLCVKCNKEQILRTKQAQRSTFYCPHCQK